jgi:hypothetical protein
MTETIDTFFVLDFDRCLGDYDANISLLKEVIDEFSIIDMHKFQSAHDEVKAQGTSFQVLDYLEKNDPNADLDIIQNEYIKRAQRASGSLLEPGALEFMDFLRASNHHFCILSFGDNQWQTTKIIASGFGDVAKLIIPNEYKGRHIAQWYDEVNGHFIIPKECFLDEIAKKAREVVLIDDKVKAFNDLPTGARGYLLQDISRIYGSAQGKVPSSVRRVTRLDEIIDKESKINKQPK